MIVLEKDRLFLVAGAVSQGKDGQWIFKAPHKRITIHVPEEFLTYIDLTCPIIAYVQQDDKQSPRVLGIYPADVSPEDFTHLATQLSAIMGPEGN